MGKTRVFVSAWVGAGNLGDELLFARLLEKLRSMGVSDVTTTSLDRIETERRFSVKALAPKDLPGSVREIRSSDLLILGPGGIIQDDTSPWSLPYQLHRVAIARAFGVPVVGMGLGVGPIRRRTSPMLLRRGLAGVAAIAVRDQQSADLLASVGIPGAVATADLVVSSTHHEAGCRDRLIVCLRPHKKGGSPVPVRMQKDRFSADRLAQLAAALDEASTALALECRFVAFEPHRDHPLHQRVAALMKTPSSLCVPGPDSVLAEVSQGRAVVAMRFHAAVAALVAERPAVLIGYSPKVDSLAQAVSPGFELVSDDADGLAGLSEKLVRAMDAPRSALVDSLRRLQEAERMNDEILRDALQG